MTINPLINFKILLTSNSPRRLSLLEAMRLDVRVQKVEVSEDFPVHLDPLQVAPHLAERKALAAKPFRKQGEIILGGDSVVISGGNILEKPKNRADAVSMLRQLSAKKHQVITGICILSEAKQVVFSDVTDVLFEPFNEEEISFYVDHYTPYDKAGSYGIQEWLGHCKVSKIEGSYTNVMGLPTALTYQVLLKEFTN